MNTINLNTVGEALVKKVAGGGGGGNYVYYSGSGDVFNGYMLASIIKVNVGSAILFIPPGMAPYINSFTSENIMGEAFDLSMKISHPLTGEFITIGKIIAENNKDWTQITEEEFYNTNLGNVSPE